MLGVSNEIIRGIRTDLRSNRSHFQIDPIVQSFLSCPQCHTLYPYIPGSTQLHCSYQKTPATPVCDTPLWKLRARTGSQTHSVPIRKYLHQDLKFWVGRLVSRKGMEDLLDRYPSIAAHPSDDAPIPDIWRSRILSSLKDADGQPFLPGAKGEGRLVFSLSVDSFNPFHMKTAKQSASSTGIWLVVLNLSPHL